MAPPFLWLVFFLLTHSKSLEQSSCWCVLKLQQSAPHFWWLYNRLYNICVWNKCGTSCVPPASELSAKGTFSFRLSRCLSHFKSWLLIAQGFLSSVAHKDGNFGRRCLCYFKESWFFASSPVKMSFMRDIKNTIGGMVNSSLKLERGGLANKSLAISGLEPYCLWIQF